MWETLSELPEAGDSFSGQLVKLCQGTFQECGAEDLALGGITQFIPIYLSIKLVQVLL